MFKHGAFGGYCGRAKKVLLAAVFFYHIFFFLIASCCEISLFVFSQWPQIIRLFRKTNSPSILKIHTTTKFDCSDVLKYIPKQMIS